MMTAKTLLCVENLYKSYSEIPILNNLSFSIYSKEIVGLLGPNGAGKTTAFYSIIGLLQPERGRIFLNGKDISSAPIHERANRGIGYLAQEPSVFRHLSVEDNILCILETLEEDKSKQKERLEDLLAELNLTALRKKKASTLSGGERRRLEITRCLIRKPSILLLDEPFANIDPLAIQEVKKLIRMLKKKDISILITDHNAREIFSVVDRSYIIQNGELMIEGTPKELTQNADARKYYLGDDFIL